MTTTRPKEAPMAMYKTICQQLLEDRPAMHERLKQGKTLLTTVNRLAGELRTTHLALADQLMQANPGSDPSQISSEAMELALKELEAGLPSESPPDEDEMATLDAAMAFLHRPTPPA
jgi:hypothetical protein